MITSRTRKQSNYNSDLCSIFITLATWLNLIASWSKLTVSMIANSTDRQNIVTPHTDSNDVDG